MPNKKSKKKKSKVKNNKKQNTSAQSKENVSRREKRKKDQPDLEAEENWDNELVDRTNFPQSSHFAQDEILTTHGDKNQESETLFAATAVHYCEPSRVKEEEVADKDDIKVKQDTKKTNYEGVNSNELSLDMRYREYLKPHFFLNRRKPDTCELFCIMNLYLAQIY